LPKRDGTSGADAVVDVQDAAVASSLGARMDGTPERIEAAAQLRRKIAPCNLLTAWDLREKRAA